MLVWNEVDTVVSSLQDRESQAPTSDGNFRSPTGVFRSRYTSLGLDDDLVSGMVNHDSFFLLPGSR